MHAFCDPHTILDAPEQMFQMANLRVMENNCANLYWYLSINVGVKGQSKLEFKCDHDPEPTWTIVWNGTSTHDGEKLCTFILKSIQNCRSYGRDKNLTFKCDLNLGPTKTNALNVLNGTSTCDGKQLCPIIWNPSTMVEVMVQTNSNRRMQAKYVPLTVSGLTKMDIY